ncbi:MAG: CinA family protein [Paludibacteraceae bacterium]|nr:CinA family protein [Paludibacteraceae bacterium]
MKNFTVCTAESCTGGNIAHQITLVPGSSAYYVGGVVSYANEVKINTLGVPAEYIQNHGAVSQPVVEAMATGVRKLMNADYSIATSGIAGPGGGSAEKPVGTVWMAVADKENVYSQLCKFSGTRTEVIEQATEAAFELFREKFGFPLIHGEQ